EAAPDKTESMLSREVRPAASPVLSLRVSPQHLLRQFHQGPLTLDEPELGPLHGLGRLGAHGLLNHLQRQVARGLPPTVRGPQERMCTIIDPRGVPPFWHFLQPRTHALALRSTLRFEHQGRAVRDGARVYERAHGSRLALPLGFGIGRLYCG